MCLLSMGPDRLRIKLHDARAAFTRCLQNKGYISSIVGGAILGAGMTIAGTVRIYHYLSMNDIFLQQLKQVIITF